MGSKYRSYGLSVCLAIVTMMMVLFGFTKADVNQDEKQCGSKLVALAPCLSYVGGESKAATPSKDCCTGLKEVVERSKVCFCILVKDHNDPSLKLKINETLALGLPEACQISGNITQCISLLHLESGSPDAKMFEDYAKALMNRTNTASNQHQPAGNATGTSTSTRPSDGARNNPLYGLEIVGLLFIVLMLHFHVSNEIVK